MKLETSSALAVAGTLSLIYLAQTMTQTPKVPAGLPRQLHALIASGYRARTVKSEIKENLLTRLREVLLK